MPLNATTYLTDHGWAGKGVPLDGTSGRGLKKPLALPMKRGLKGLGKERDRAVEWWDCVFEAGAKKLGGGTGEARISNGVYSAKTSEAESSADAHLSLEARAKRAYARRMLMNGFVRGKPDLKQQRQEEELERRLVEQQHAAQHRSELAGSLDESDRNRKKSKKGRHGQILENAEITQEVVAPDISNEAARRKRREEKRQRRKEQQASNAPELKDEGARLSKLKKIKQEKDKERGTDSERSSVALKAEKGVSRTSGERKAKKSKRHTTAIDDNKSDAHLRSIRHPSSDEAIGRDSKANRKAKKRKRQDSSAAATDF